MKLLPIINDISNTTQQVLLGGEQRELATEKVTIYYPGDNATVVGECFRITAEHIPMVEEVAGYAFQEYRESNPSQRAEILTRLAEQIELNREPLAHLITMESGKPVSLSKAEVKRAVQLCRDYAAEAGRNGSQTLWVEGREGRVGYFPLGPVLAITPFNFPLNLVLHKLAPAIAAGCSITIKPDLRTPLTALYLARLAIEAGYRAISVVPCDNDVAELLVKSEAFKKLSFTGSAKVGWHLKSIAGKKSVTLELGGNSAVIIDELTDSVEAMAARVAFGAFAYAGQICISVQRILVNRKLYEEFTPALVSAIRAMKVGDPMKSETLIGPLITIDDVQRTRTIIKDAIFAGANVVYGGNTYNALTMNPTLLDRTTPEMAVNREECFAPVATIAAYNTFEEALAMVNDSRYGLQTGLYTSDRNKIEQAYAALDVGGVIINDIPTYRADRLPYGGVKDSGTGREGVLSGIAEMSYPKTLVMKP